MVMVVVKAMIWKCVEIWKKGRTMFWYLSKSGKSFFVGGPALPRKMISEGIVNEKRVEVF
ncbi:hypothetical protein CISIN_1g0024082mg, partial [Citrus sinensis]